MIPDKPKGGTELMYEELMKRINPILLEDISIFNYIPQADFNKITVYWNQLSYDQEAVQFLRDEEIKNKIDYFVFVSHWQAEQFRKIFNIPGFKTRVIKNAASSIEPKNPEVKNEKIKICYTSTPWRGLDILLAAWEEMNSQDCELHVFSSTKIYGKDYHFASDNQYASLYEKAKSLPNVFYRDYVENEELRKELPTFDILAYPCIFEETSCIAAIEAISAGLKVVCSNLGALPETTEGWADLYTIKIDSQLHKEQFKISLINALQEIKNNQYSERVAAQTNIYRHRWSWDNRVFEWADFLKEVQLNKTNSQSVEPLSVEEPVEYIQFSELGANDIVIDIGSNTGSFARKIIDGGINHIICVEPSPTCIEELRANLSVYGNATIIEKAAWSKSGLNISFNTQRFSNSQFSTAFVRGGNHRVDTVSLDDILVNIEKVRLLKIDAEGAEYPVLMSSSQLDKVEEIIGVVNDISPERQFDIPLSFNRTLSANDLFNFLESQGYQLQLRNAPTNGKIIFRAFRT